MTTEEAKKAGFRMTSNPYIMYWYIEGNRIAETCRSCEAAFLTKECFPTRAKAREALRKRKLEAAAQREDARIAARKAAGTQVPPTAPSEPLEWCERDTYDYSIPTDEVSCDGKTWQSAKAEYGIGWANLQVGMKVQGGTLRARYRNPLWLANYGKDVVPHETPVGETQDPEPKMSPFTKPPYVTPEWMAWKARQDAKASNKEPVAPVEVTKHGTTESEKSSNKPDAVSHPSHYTSHPSGVECITITKHMNFCRGNAVKYLWRAGQKGDTLDKEIEDIAKAEEYCRVEKERLIAKKGEE